MLTPEKTPAQRLRETLAKATAVYLALPKWARDAIDTSEFFSPRRKDRDNDDA